MKQGKKKLFSYVSSTREETNQRVQTNHIDSIVCNGVTDVIVMMRP